MNKKWVSYRSDYSKIDEMASLAGVSGLTSAVLLNRGIDTTDQLKNFFHPDLAQLEDPMLLPDMEDAVDRIMLAIENSEKILIYGDYDVDGITSTTVLLKFFQYVHGDAAFFIPDRRKDGYGMSLTTARSIVDQGYDLVITVDCGITAVEVVDFFNENFIDVVITDHHACGDQLPAAVANVNPSRSDSAYAFSSLAGVGVAFQLVRALARECNCEALVGQLISFAAIGTVADVVSLKGENRAIVSCGLEQIRKTENPGLLALLESVNITPENLRAEDIAFTLAPRLNAAGRMQHASIGVELFMTMDRECARAICATLNELNETRKEVERAIMEDVVQKIKETKEGENDNALVLFGEQWHNGVLGIVASKLLDQWQKPVILLSNENGLLKGSARSTANINIYDVLLGCNDFIVQFGGHAQVAGMTIEKAKFYPFAKRVNEVIGALQIKPEKPSIWVDYRLTGNDVRKEIIEELRKLEPFGCDNPKPVFVYRNLRVLDARTVGKDHHHLRLLLADNGRELSAIGFGMGNYINVLSKGQKIDIIGTMELNTWNGIEKVQLKIEDFNIKN